MGLSRPQQLAPAHVLSAFCCGEEAIDSWLQKRARKNHDTGASKVFVVCDGSRVIAFYTLSASSIVRKGTKGKFQRNMPDQIPVMLLGQLGVDQHYQRRGLATALVKDALLRSLSVADQTAGVAAVYADALTPDLIPLYEHFGFESISETDPTAMMIRMKDVRAVLSGR